MNKDGVLPPDLQYFDAKTPSPGDVLTLLDLAVLADSARYRFGNGRINARSQVVLGFGALVLTACSAAAATKEIPTPITLDTGPADSLSLQPLTLENTNVDAILTATPGVPPTVIDQAAISDYVISHASLPDYLSASEVGNQPLEAAAGATISPLTRLTLDQYGFVPVLGAEGSSGYENGKVYYPKPMAEISDANGTALKLDVGSEENWYVYKSNDGQVLQYMPKSVECQGECVTAVSYNKNAPGVTQIFDMNPDTGEVTGIAQAFYTSKNDVVKFGAFDKDKWRTEITGPDAIILGLRNGAEGMVYDQESNTISFQVDKTVIWAELEEFKTSSEFGFYVTSDEGTFLWADNNWVKADENLSPSGAKRYSIGGQNFVEIDGAMVWIDTWSEANGNLTIVKDGRSFTWESGKWAPIIEGSLAIENLDSHTWGSYSIIENTDGYYEMKDSQGNLIPDVKLFSDSTAELKYDSKKLTVAFEAITIGPDGQLAFGLWDYQNDKWTMAPGHSAEDIRSGEYANDFHKLVVVRGNDEIESRLTDTIFMARDLYMNNTQGYRPASEFEGITVTYNFKTVENFDVRPKEWQMNNFSRNWKALGKNGAYRFQPFSQNNEVVYDDRSTLSYARPMQVGLLGPGWFKVDIYNKGELSQSAYHAPIVAMNTDRSLIHGSALIDKDNLSNVIPLLNRDDRGKLRIFLFSKTIVPMPSLIFSNTELMSFTSSINHANYVDIVGVPELDTDYPLQSFPKEFSKTLLTLVREP